jgi:hypothetical protein
VDLMLVEIYGSLLNADERKKIKGTMTEKGIVERKGWKPSFDKKSHARNEAVLNLVQTNDSNDVYYTCVYEADNDAYSDIMSIEMGQANIENRKNSEQVKFNSYRLVQLESNVGTTRIFIIPKNERIPNTTSWEAPYVVIVRKGIEMSFKNRPDVKEANLWALKRAVEESGQKCKREMDTKQ